MLNDAMNNPIVLALALTAVVLAFAIHAFVY
jgi:multisubunit Na+/H+ antiporter MnhC subunit